MVVTPYGLSNLNVIDSPAMPSTYIRKSAELICAATPPQDVNVLFIHHFYVYCLPDWV
ncbi:MAG: hypothetical protein QOH83_1598 [Solirubrobacteraceae bacterium]|nr:hypothetical protein [Solirubrobacteraceae bacterium]